MKLSGWAWIISGIIIAVVSAYVYWGVPRNGQPNTAMAVFFFVGGIFIIVGIIKLFFKRVDSSKSIIDSVQPGVEPKIVTMEEHAEKEQVRQFEQQPEPINRVDKAVQDMAKQEQQTQRPMSQQFQSGQASRLHTNAYYKGHGYKGPVQEIKKQVQQSTQNNQAIPQHQHPIHNTEQHSVRCRKCGTTNTAIANYCHSCGNRLK